MHKTTVVRAHPRKTTKGRTLVRRHPRQTRQNRITVVAKACPYYDDPAWRMRIQRTIERFPMTRPQIREIAKEVGIQTEVRDDWERLSVEKMIYSRLHKPLNRDILMRIDNILNAD